MVRCRSALLTGALGFYSVLQFRNACASQAWVLAPPTPCAGVVPGSRRYACRAARHTAVPAERRAVKSQRTRGKRKDEDLSRLATFNTSRQVAGTQCDGTVIVGNR